MFSKFAHKFVGATAANFGKVSNLQKFLDEAQSKRLVMVGEIHGHPKVVELQKELQNALI